MHIMVQRSIMVCMCVEARRNVCPVVLLLCGVGWV